MLIQHNKDLCFAFAASSQKAQDSIEFGILKQYCFLPKNKISKHQKQIIMHCFVVVVYLPKL